jgi:preprotein translocase subunit SecE
VANDPEETTTPPEDVAADDAAPEPTPEELDSDPSVAEAEAIAEQVASSRPVRKAATTTATKKETATRKRREAEAGEEEKRTGPIQFVAQSIEELKKVNWPTLSQWQQYFWVVLVFVLFIIAYIALIDFGLGAAILAIFG